MTRPIWLVVVALGGACGEATHAVERADLATRASTSLPSTQSGWSPPITFASAPSMTTSSVTSSPSSVASPSIRSCKVEPPIAVTLTSRAIAGDRYELIATATPTQAIDAIDLAIDLPAGATITKRTTNFGATRAGEPRTLVATVTTTARTTELAAFARFPFDGVTMSRATTITVGEPPPVQHMQQYALPDGELVREVRP